MQNRTILADSGDSTPDRENAVQRIPFAVPLACPAPAHHADLPDGFRLMEAAKVCSRLPRRRPEIRGAVATG